MTTSTDVEMNHKWKNIKPDVFVPTYLYICMDFFNVLSMSPSVMVCIYVSWCGVRASPACNTSAVWLVVMCVLAVFLEEWRGSDTMARWRDCKQLHVFQSIIHFSSAKKSRSIATVMHRKMLFTVLLQNEGYDVFCLILAHIFVQSQILHKYALHYVSIPIFGWIFHVCFDFLVLQGVVQHLKVHLGH
jgi:hypothetical protein